MTVHEKEVLEIFQSYLKAYFADRNLEETLQHLGDLTGFGTGVDEVAPPADMKKLYKRDINQIPNSVVVKNEKFYTKSYADNVVNVWGTLDIESEIDGFPFALRDMRITSLMVKNSTDWLMEHLHISLPFIEQEDNESYPLQKLEERNKILEEVVNRRTLELQKINEELKNSNSQKDKLFSIISHDLRNPAGAVNNFLAELYNNYENMSDTDRREIIQLSFESGELLQARLLELLEWGIVSRGLIKINKEEIILSDFIDELIKLLEINAKQKNITIEISNFKSVVKTDRNMLKTVLRNLIDNAIKFSDNNGQIKLTYNQDENSHYISVEDNGIGIAEDRIDELFEIDKSTSTEGTNREKGTGLGLPTSKEFIELCGGQINVKSKLDHGTTFTIKLPK